jgi:transcriptional regulator with XRE-family HTH domain
MRLWLYRLWLDTRNVGGRRDRDAYVRVAAVIRDLRRAHGWTQTELAARLGVGQTFVSKVELGERRVDVVEAAALARVLGVTVGEMLRRAGVSDRPTDTEEPT